MWIYFYVEYSFVVLIVIYLFYLFIVFVPSLRGSVIAINFSTADKWGISIGRLQYKFDRPRRLNIYLQWG